MPGSLWIQERDKKILKAAFEHKVLDLESIHGLAFEGVNIEVARRRVLKLCAYGYLERIPFLREAHHISLFSPTQNSIRQIRENYPGELVIKALRSYCPEHDLFLFKLRRRLEKCAMVKRFITENMLQSLLDLKNSSEFGEFSKLHSDGVCTIVTNTSRLNIAIEFENSEQSRSRYESRFKDYYIRSSIHLVIYICSRPQTLKTLSEIDKDLRGTGNHKIFFGLSEDILNSKDKLVFENLSKAKVVLK